MEVLRELGEAVGLVKPQPNVDWPNPLRQLRRVLIKQGNTALASGRQWVWYRKHMKRRGIDLKVMARLMAQQARSK